MASIRCSDSSMSQSLERYLSLYSYQQQLLRRVSFPSSQHLSPTPVSILPPTPPAIYRSPSSSSGSERSSLDLSFCDGSGSSSLRSVSQEIKCELTSLLNQSRNTNDEDLRTWLQARLLDAEHELKRLRRRHGGDSLRSSFMET